MHEERPERKSVSAATAALTPAPEGKPEAREGEQEAGIRRVAKQPIGAAPHQGLALLDRHLTPEMTAEGDDCPGPQPHAREDQRHPHAKRPPVVGPGAQGRRPRRDQQGCDQTHARGEHDDPQGPAVLCGAPSGDAR